MRQKLFIGIDLDPHLKKALVKATKPWKDLPIRFHPEDSLHLTLAYIGYVDETQVTEILEHVRVACERIESFTVSFEKIALAHKNNDENANPADAKMLWLTGEASDELKNLQESIEKELGLFVAPKKQFRPHVTLGRMRAKKWQALEEYPDMNQSFPLEFDVSAVTVFESASTDGKRQYAPLEVCELGG